jgi:hypothetical protein
MDEPNLTTTVLIPAVVSLAGSLLVTALGWLWALRRKQMDDHARLLADAWAAVQAYKEYAFAIRRRNPNDPEGERVRLSEAIREVQQNLSFHTAWISGVSPHVSERYNILVGETRKIAGKLMRDAWQHPPITADAGMNLPEIAAELAHLRVPEYQYLDAVQRHLHPLRWRLRHVQETNGLVATASDQHGSGRRI